MHKKKPFIYINKNINTNKEKTITQINSLYITILFRQTEKNKQTKKKKKNGKKLKCLLT